MSDDLIKRSDAIDAIHREARLAGGSVAIEYADMFQDAIKALPSADRPQGEWEDYDRYMKCCSKCGWIHDILHYGAHFCPNCGANMKGADDEDN